MNIPPATLMPLVLAGVSKETQGRASRWLEFVKRLARVSEVVFADKAPGRRGAIPGARRSRGAAAERRDRSRAPNARACRRNWPRPSPTSSASTRSSNNPKFVANAAEDVVEGEKEKREEAEGRRAKILEALERLKGAA